MRTYFVSGETGINHICASRYWNIIVHADRHTVENGALTFYRGKNRTIVKTYASGQWCSFRELKKEEYIKILQSNKTADTEERNFQKTVIFVGAPLIFGSAIATGILFHNVDYMWLGGALGGAIFSLTGMIAGAIHDQKEKP